MAALFSFAFFFLFLFLNIFIVGGRGRDGCGESGGRCGGKVPRGILRGECFVVPCGEKSLQIKEAGEY